MRYKAVLFDLDGTILDTIGELAFTMNVVRTKFGLDEQPMEEVRAMVGNGIRNLIKRSIANDEGADADKLFESFMNYYIEHCVENTFPYDGVEEMLTELKSKGYKLAVVSNKADAPSNKLINHFFPGVFDYVRGHKEGTELKPNPQVIDETLSILGVSREDAVYVGDSEVDIKTASNSGMPCISVDWGFKTHEFLVEHGGTKIVSDMDSLKNAIFEG